MSSEGNIKWPGASGSSYDYQIYKIGTEFKNVPGNYIFAKETSQSRWTPIYIGETSNLSERFDDHHKMPCIRRHGSTHIHVHTSSSNANVRRTEESDLLAAWNTTCND